MENVQVSAISGSLTQSQTVADSKLARIVLSLMLILVLNAAIYYASNYFHFDAVNFELSHQQSKVNELRAQNDESDKLKAESAELQKSLEQAEAQLRSLNPLIPSEAELPAVLNAITVLAAQRNLRLEHFSQGQRIPGDISEIPLTVNVFGSYYSIEHFTDAIARTGRLMRVNSARLQQEANQSENGTVHAQINISIFVGNSPKSTVK